MSDCLNRVYERICERGLPLNRRDGGRGVYWDDPNRNRSKPAQPLHQLTGG